MKNKEKITGYPSIDKPWLAYYDATFDEKNLPQKTIFELAYERNKDNMSNIAIDIRMSTNNFNKGITITYKEFFFKIKQCAKASNALGIKEKTGPMVMQHYLNNSTETDNVIHIHKDGKRWIHTKDIGYMDESGHVFHLERIKNIFMRTGFNVHPSTISEFINTLKFVKNSYVIGFEHPSEQCVPIAFIIADKSYNKSNEEIEKYIQEECYKNLEETSVPYGYVFVNVLPVNLGGKIDGRAIKVASEIDLIKEDSIPKKELFFK